ncbi:MAG TPA: restriction endonuclease [Jatrophihabitans sp.]|jgi:restriction system protein|uniref:restriction endonuclease n=1 Tax=Jatrophihabitans sp. TaxID=1932789 RepID=UPI002EF7749B
MTLWMVRAGRHGEGESEALASGFVGIGWPELGDLSRVRSSAEVRALADATYKDAKPSTLANWAGQIDAFRHRMRVGDLVALPLKSSPAIAFGRVTGEYRHVSEADAAIRHQRAVSWISEGIPRELIDQDLLYSLGAFLTVCRIKRNNAEARIRALLDAPHQARPWDGGSAAGEPTVVTEPEEASDAAIDLLEIGRDQIRRRLAERFRGHDFARLVGELLRAEGFFCEVSPAGPDGGVDVLAGEGGMGFDGATLAVQVKSGAQVCDAPTLRELKGVMSNFGATRGLLVSWGGFTKSARQEARRLFFEIRLWDSDAVIEKLQQVYDRLPADLQAEIPLQRIWTVLPEEG